MSEWRKSSYSGSQGSCVEIKMTDDSVLVRDTKNRGGGTVEFPTADWQAFIESIKLS